MVPAANGQMFAGTGCEGATLTQTREEMGTDTHTHIYTQIGI